MRWRSLIAALVLVTRLASAGADSSFTAAKNAFDTQHFDIAATQFELFVKAFPDDSRIGTAAMDLLDALNQATPPDLERFERAVDELLPLTGIQGADRERLLALHEQLQRRHAETMEAQHKPAEAAKIFADLAKLSTNPKARYELWFNAGRLFDQAHDFAQAIAMFHEAAATNIAPEMIGEAFRYAAVLEEPTHPLEAAEDYARVPMVGCNSSQTSCRNSADARFNAGQLFLALGRYKRAATLFESYGKDFATQDDADRAALLAGYVAELLRDDGRAEAAFAGYVKRAHPKQPEFAYLRLGYAAARRGERAKADQAFLRSAKLSANRPELAALAGEAKLAHADLLARDAAAVKLTVPAKKLVAALKERSRLVEAALAAYDDVAVAHDLEWMIAALDHAAHVYDDFAGALLAATPPPLETDADKLSYRHEIELFASGVTNKVIERYRAAYDTALGTNIHSEYVIDARRQLTRFDPKQYPAEHEAREGLRVEPAFVPTILTGMY
jgi:tetratricopeptide (TPR) repeat protein